MSVNELHPAIRPKAGKLSMRILPFSREKLRAVMNDGYKD